MVWHIICGIITISFFLPLAASIVHVIMCSGILFEGEIEGDILH